MKTNPQIKKITKKQKEVFDFIQAFLNKEGVPPSYADIQSYFGFKAKSTVFDYVHHLKRAGLLEIDAKGIQKTETGEAAAETFLAIPLLGTVAAGKPLPTVDALFDEEGDLARIRVPPSLLVGHRQKNQDHLYALQVEGHSMIEDCIMEGDFIIVQAQETAVNGQTVVALLHQGATVKKFYHESYQDKNGEWKQRIILRPANQTMKPFILEDEDRDHFRLQGIVVGLLRKYPDP